MNEENWKEKVFILLKKFRISNSVLWQIYKPFSRILNFIKHGDLYFFRSVAIEISTSCNRTCYYCPNSLEETPIDFMAQETFNKIIKQLEAIKFSGFDAANWFCVISHKTSLRGPSFSSEFTPLTP